jgi:6-phosphogluconolactonase
MKTLVYVPNADDGSVCVLALQPQGQLTEVQRVSVGGAVMPMTVSPDRHVLYVARRSEPFEVVALSIAPSDGRLGLLGHAPLPASMAYICSDRTGRWLLAASYPGHLLSVSAIDEHGVPEAAHQIVSDVPNAHCVRPSRDNRSAFVASLGADELRSYSFDAERGLLDARMVRCTALTPRSGPRHIELHPVLDVAYVIDELDGQLHVFDIEGATLHLRQSVDGLPPDRPSPIWSADVRATPDGRFVYASERTGSTVAGYRVDPSSGDLSLVGHWTTQRRPRAIQVDCLSHFLLVAGQASNHVGVHAIHGDGTLSTLAPGPVGINPSWIEIVSLAE